MRILTTKTTLLYQIIFCAIPLYLHAQSGKTDALGNAKFDKLLQEKRKINPSIALNDHYKLQIFSGDADKAKKTIQNFKQDYNDVEATVIFNTPNYKVWVGSFKTRMEAEKFKQTLDKKYKNILLVRPNKS